MSGPLITLSAIFAVLAYLAWRELSGRNEVTWKIGPTRQRPPAAEQPPISNVQAGQLYLALLEIWMSSASEGRRPLNHTEWSYLQALWRFKQENPDSFQDAESVTIVSVEDLPPEDPDEQSRFSGPA